METKKSWEHFPHEADVGVRGRGSSKEEAFEQAALAMMAVITDPTTVSPTEMVPITCKAPDDELLLVDWLNALVYEMATRHILFAHFVVHITDHYLQAEAWGEKIDVTKHQPAIEIKGATYTALRVRQNAQGEWIAQCVVDV